MSDIAPKWVPLSTHIFASTKRALRIAAAEQETTVQALVNAALRAYLNLPAESRQA